MKIIEKPKHSSAVIFGVLLSVFLQGKEEGVKRGTMSAKEFKEFFSEKIDLIVKILN